MDVSKFHCTDMNVHNYTMQSGMKITSLEMTLESLKTESSKFSMTVQMCSGE